MICPFVEASNKSWFDYLETKLLDIVNWVTQSEFKLMIESRSDFVIKSNVSKNEIVVVEQPTSWPNSIYHFTEMQLIIVHFLNCEVWHDL